MILLFISFINQVAISILISYLATKVWSEKNVFILLGGDFQYMKAEGNFHRADQLIQKINSHNTSDVYLTYSTPSCYLEAIKNEKWTSRNGDFMPYVSSKKVFVACQLVFL